jgi:ABC-type branched-subunit amino acid transport system ATPase component
MIPSSLLETHGLTAFYGDFQALFGIDFHIERNETVAIIGSNGAGKSTFLKSIILKTGMAGVETAQATQHQTNPIAPRWTFRVRTH